MATAAAVCSLDNYLVLPDHTMDDRITAAREALGRECVILGHHYQRDEVIRFADFRGDSYKLSQEAARAGGNIHRLLRRAFYGGKRRRVEPPRPGDHPARSETPAAPWPTWPKLPKWRIAGTNLIAVGLTNDTGDRITPITYMNSTAAIKAFCGERGGMVCTSSNASGAFQWGLAKTPKISFPSRSASRPQYRVSA